MCLLRTTICKARADLDVVLLDNFDKQPRLSLECLQVELLTLPWNDAQDVRHNLYNLFENRGLLEETGLNDIEKQCFQHCSTLLREGEISIKALAS